MKIIYYTHPYFADCDFPLIRELRNQGHKIICILVITQDSLKSTLINIKKTFPKNGFFSTNIYPEIEFYKDYIGSEDTYILNNVTPKKNFIEKLKFMVQTRNFINQFKADYIWTTLPFKQNEWILYSFKNIAITIHDPFPHSGEELSLRNKINKILALKLSKKIFILNQSLKKQFSESFNIPPSKIFTNKLGLYDCIKLYNPNTSKIEIQKPYILFYGRISKYKGVEYLLEAFIKLHKLIPELNLIIAGGGDFYFDYKKYSNLNYINIRNYFINMDETAFLFKNADFVVCPYTDATQSGVIMTAYTMNKPVIASDVGAIKETVINNETGLLVKPKDINELFDKMHLLYTDKKLKNTIENNIKNKYSKGENSWPNISKEFILALENK